MHKTEEKRNPKMFRNCPRPVSNCTECDKKLQCMVRKVNRRYRIRVKKKMIILLLIIAIIIFIGAIIYSSKSGYYRPLFPTNEVTTLDNNRGGVITTATIGDSMVPSGPASDNFIKGEVASMSEAIEIVEEIQDKESVMISSTGPTSDKPVYQITDDERKLLEKMVYQEARGESLDCKVATAAVPLNRKNSGNNRDFRVQNIITIITQKGQFASIANVTQKDLDANPECALAVDLALRGWDPTREKFSEGALYFYNPKTVKGYQKRKREGIDVLVIGHHNFHVNFEK